MLKEYLEFMRKQSGPGIQREVLKTHMYYDTNLTKKEKYLEDFGSLNALLYG